MAKRQPPRSLSPRAPRRAGWKKRAAFGVAAAFALGGLIGVVASRALPAGGLSTSARIHHALLTDDAASLARVAQLADGSDTDDNPAGALAWTLLSIDHLAGAPARAHAEKLLQRATPTLQVTGEALYARALLVGIGGKDPRLDDDLRKQSASTDPWTALARAERARRAGNVDDAIELARQAALGPRPPSHADVVLARLMALRGDLEEASAVVDRVLRRAPALPGALVLGLAIDLQREGALDEDARSRRRAPHRERASTASSAISKEPVRSWTEERILDVLAAGDVAELDEQLLRVAVLAAARARADVDLVREQEAALAAMTLSHEALAARIDVQLLDGDVAAAQAALAAASPEVAGAPELVGPSLRTRMLGQIPAAERTGQARAIVDRTLRLPLGELVWDVDVDGFPWHAVFAPGFSADAGLLAAAAHNDDASARATRLAVVENLALADRALVRGDLAAARTWIATARSRGGADAEVALADAALKLRIGDHAGCREALDAALAASPEEPRVLLEVARLHAAHDDLTSARKALHKLRTLGIKSPPTLAIEAMLQARAGDVAAARTALSEAQRTTPDDVLVARAAVVVARLSDAGEARKAADALLAREGLSSSDPMLRAWLADAIYRQGDAARAESTLAAVLQAEPKLGDAHLFFAESIRWNPTRAKEAYDHAVRALEFIDRGPLVDEAKALALALKSAH